MATTTMVHVRVDEQIKAQATETLAAMAEADDIARTHPDAAYSGLRKIVPERLGAVVSGRPVRHEPT